ncbi:MAG: type A chloramphenicol O-acetyltransferase [Eubacteriales bacterium]
MIFTVIDQNSWPRKEYFEHYFSAVPCTYSMTTKLDITPIKNSHQKLYPTMLYHLATVVNRHAEFRMAFNQKGELGVYDEMSPCYTVFHEETETFSNVWTEYCSNYKDFCAAYEKDLSLYGKVEKMEAKPAVPENTFPVSMVPWTTFEGFNLNLKNGYSYLLPIFTMGKYFEENGKILLPLSIQVHHAVCDGFHVCRFVSDLQELIHQGV